MDLRWPVCGGLAVAAVECEVYLCLLVGEGCERRFDVGPHVVGHGNDEEGRVGEDACPACDILDGDAAIAFAWQGADLVVVVLYVEVSKGFCASAGVVDIYLEQLEYRLREPWYCC